MVHAGVEPTADGGMITDESVGRSRAVEAVRVARGGAAVRKMEAEDMFTGELARQEMAAGPEVIDLGLAEVVELDPVELIEVDPVEFVELDLVEVIEVVALDPVELIEMDPVEFTGLDLVEVIELDLAVVIELDLAKVIELDLVGVLGAVRSGEFVAESGTSPPCEVSTPAWLALTLPAQTGLR